jgi:Phytanoyl-CoA dioxygenase (PhyH)
VHSDLGFKIVRDVIGQTDFSAIARLLESGPRSRAGRRHLLQDELVRDVAQDPHLLRLAAEFIGDGPLPYKATLFDKSSRANWLVSWHQDTALPLRSRTDAKGWGPWSVKAGQLYAHAPATVLERIVALRLHLDDSSADNGPLRVLPRTHRLGRLSEERIRQLASDLEPVECIVPAGGVVVMRPLAVHASSRSRSEAPRRVLHIEYACALDLGAGIEPAVA